jgi:23S rRNA (uridine2552-2'-O)-methyltransferase
MVRSKSSARWLRRHARDPYVKRARAQGYRSRAAYKLLEIDARDRLLWRGATVVDLGAAPGGWSQVACEKVGPGGRVVAVDVLPIAPIGGATLLRGDFREAQVRAQLGAALGGAKADVVLSDLSPNVSGIAATDQARMAELVQLALGFAREHLKQGGVLLAKAFQGADFDRVLEDARAVFASVRIRKPAASRGESPETYLLGRGLKPSGS